MTEDRNEKLEKIGFRDTLCMILACYQAFAPMVLSMTAGLIGAFVLIGVFLN